MCLPPSTCLHFSTANLEWLITAYALTFGAYCLGGRTGDLYGKRRMFMAGIAIFAGPRSWEACHRSGVAYHHPRHAGIGAPSSPTALSLMHELPEGRERNKGWAFTRHVGAGGAIGLLLADSHHIRVVG